ncbi:unnamed protein product [marine sediment metagenome]|uniref:Uncharacterized protein n=1 Tax=marine sediment metagenome TaxID=412755 RepID=X0YTP2_9ZZZZ
MIQNVIDQDIGVLLPKFNQMRYKKKCLIQAVIKKRIIAQQLMAAVLDFYVPLIDLAIAMEYCGQ